MLPDNTNESKGSTSPLFKRYLTGTSGIFLTLTLFLLAACGANTSTGSNGTSTTTSATATVCAQVTRTAGNNRTTTGTLKSMNGQSLVVTTVAGKDVNVTYTSTTRFVQDVKLSASDLTQGSTVRVAVATAADGTYNATSIIVTTGITGNGNGNGTGNGNRFGTPRATTTNPCATRKNGTPAVSGTSTTFRGITGTVTNVNGNSLTITDTSKNTFTVNITANTTISETKTVTSAALQVGQPLTITGKNSQGTVTATLIAILPALPTTSNGG